MNLQALERTNAGITPISLASVNYAIIAAIAGVPNPDPTKFAAVTAEFQA
jgi:hypothetical protein